MSVSFDEALDTLVSMFGDWDRETLSLVLESQNYRLESAIEFILESGGTGGEGGSGDGGVSQGAPPPTSTNLLDMGESDLSPPATFGQARAAPAPTAAAAPTQQGNKARGILFELPRDFLRVPQQRGVDNHIISDEELAMMMQNELYLRAINEVQRDRQENPENKRREHPLAANGEIPDMGILKGLNTVGSAMKTGFGSLTSKLAAMTDSSSKNSNSYGEDEDNAEMNPLVQGLRQDDDDDEEAVEFLTSPHARRIAGSSSNSSSSNIPTTSSKKDR